MADENRREMTHKHSYLYMLFIRSVKTVQKHSNMLCKLNWTFLTEGQKWESTSDNFPLHHQVANPMFSSFFVSLPINKMVGATSDHLIFLKMMINGVIIAHGKLELTRIQCSETFNKTKIYLYSIENNSPQAVISLYYASQRRWIQNLTNKEFMFVNQKAHFAQSKHDIQANYLLWATKGALSRSRDNKSPLNRSEALKKNSTNNIKKIKAMEQYLKKRELSKKSCSCKPIGDLKNNLKYNKKDVSRNMLNEKHQESRPNTLLKPSNPNQSSHPYGTNAPQTTSSHDGISQSSDYVKEIYSDMNKEHNNKLKSLLHKFRPKTRSTAMESWRLLFSPCDQRSSSVICPSKIEIKDSKHYNIPNNEQDTQINSDKVTSNENKQSEMKFNPNLEELRLNATMEKLKAMTERNTQIHNIFKKTNKDILGFDPGSPMTEQDCIDKSCNEGVENISDNYIENKELVLFDQFIPAHNFSNSIPNKKESDVSHWISKNLQNDSVVATQCNNNLKNQDPQNKFEHSPYIKYYETDHLELNEAHKDTKIEGGEPQSFANQIQAKINQNNYENINRINSETNGLTSMPTNVYFPDEKYKTLKEKSKIGGSQNFHRNSHEIIGPNLNNKNEKNSSLTSNSFNEGSPESKISFGSYEQMDKQSFAVLKNQDLTNGETKLKEQSVCVLDSFFMKHESNIKNDTQRNFDEAEYTNNINNLYYENKRNSIPLTKDNLEKISNYPTTKIKEDLNCKDKLISNIPCHLRLNETALKDNDNPFDYNSSLDRNYRSQLSMRATVDKAEMNLNNGDKYHKHQLENSFNLLVSCLNDGYLNTEAHSNQKAKSENLAVKNKYKLSRTNTRSSLDKKIILQIMKKLQSQNNGVLSHIYEEYGSIQDFFSVLVTRVLKSTEIVCKYLPENSQPSYQISWEDDFGDLLIALDLIYALCIFNKFPQKEGSSAIEGIISLKSLNQIIQKCLKFWIDTGL